MGLRKPKKAEEIKLPDLTNAASAAHILSGYQALNGDGEVMEGNYVPPKIKSGTYKPSSVTKTITISGIGFKPSKFFATASSIDNYGRVMQVYIDFSNNIKKCGSAYGKTDALENCTASVTDDSITITAGVNSKFSNTNMYWTAIG